jgi:hypothetical protein
MPYYQKKDVAKHFKAVIACPAFAKTYLPSDEVEENGIYACTVKNCQYEIALKVGDYFPRYLSCSDHGLEHVTKNQEPTGITWLLVAAPRKRNPDNWT